MADQRYTPYSHPAKSSLPLNARHRRREDIATYNSSIGGELLLVREDFQLRLANSRGRQAESSELVQRMYAWRGYKHTQGQSTQRAHEATLQTCQGHDVFGTLTIRYDSDAGLAADALYRTELDAYRSAGARVAELTRLAVDPKLGSKEVLGALFHAAYVFCGPLGKIDDVFIEVNPRHVAFYQRMLDFQQAGEPRICPRVDATAVLLHVQVAHVGQQAALFGGRELQGQRSLYPYFCSREEEEQIRRRMVAVERLTNPASSDRRARSADRRANSNRGDRRRNSKMLSPRR
jgi:hypothetical protein